MFNYFGFGLDIKSEIEFPELISVDQNAPNTTDISISLGTCPHSLEGENVIKKVRNWTKPNEFLMWIKNIVRIHVINGSNITVEPLSDPVEWKSIRTFLLSSAFAAVLHQRRMFPIHASAVKDDDGIILFVGESGVGKSTTAAFLKQKGYTIFSDDVCVLHKQENDNDQVYAYSSYPMMRHWSDTIDAIDNPEFSKKYPVREHILKYGNFFHNEFDQSMVPIKLIVEIQLYNKAVVEKINITKLSDKILCLHRYIFRKGQLDGIGGKVELFKTLSDIAKNVDIIKFKRPIGTNSIQEFIDIIDNELQYFRPAQKL